MRTNNSLAAPNYRARLYGRAVAIAAIVVTIVFVSIKLEADTGTCAGASVTLPFLDVANTNIFFCSIAEAYFSGITNGTSGMTYSPGDLVPRDQMAAFTGRTLDQSVKRASKRAALQQFWTIQTASNLGLTSLGSAPIAVQSDGADVWVAVNSSNGVSRVRGSDGKLLATWTGATKATGVLCAMGKVFIVGLDPGKLYQIDPTQAVGDVTTVTSSLGSLPSMMAFDGQRIWTANASGSVSIVTLNPLNVTTVSAGFIAPEGILYDGANIWVTDAGANGLKKLDSNGNILQSLALGSQPRRPVFDGTNIWVPCDDSVWVVRATGAMTGTILAVLFGNGLNSARQAAFDGERILVTNFVGDSVSLWKASDLSPIGTFSTGTGSVPIGVCSDGLNFWITLLNTNALARF